MPGILQTASCCYKLF